MLRQFLHIIRWPNLAMIGVVQGIIYYMLMDTATSILKGIDFLVLSFITMLIAGGGYIINDYYDHQIDAVNKPKKWIAGNVWSLQTVFKSYMIVGIVGGLLSVYLAIKLSLLPFLAIYPVAVGALWMYSYALKCKPLIGNIWVALFCAGVILVIALPDWLTGNDSAIEIHLFYYAAFAFLATWYREIIKDIEDIEGDRRMGCKTFVVRFGVRSGKFLALVIVALLVFAVYYWIGIQTKPSMEVALNILQGFIVTSMAFVWWAKDKTYFYIASLLIKVVMLLGTIVLLLL